MSNVIVEIKGKQNFEINGSCEVTEINFRDRLIVVLVNNEKHITHFKKIDTKEHLYPERLEIKFKRKKESCKLIFEASNIEEVFPSNVMASALKYVQGGDHIEIIIPLLQFLYEQARKEKKEIYAAEMIRLEYVVKYSEIRDLRSRAERLESKVYSYGETSLLSSYLEYECRKINFLDMKNKTISIEDSIAVGHVMKFKSIEIDVIKSRIKDNASLELNILLDSDRMIHLNFPKVSLYRSLNSEFIFNVESVIGREERKRDALAVIDLIEILCEIYDDLTMPDDPFKSSVSKLKEIKKHLEESFTTINNK